MEYYGTSFWAPTNTLAHYGIKGQKWGERHWQNEDGTFNEAGKKRYFGNGGGENYKPVRSAGGNARRALAKVYSVNEKYYSKHGNKAMANANKQAKERMLKKADEADKKKEKQINDANKARSDIKNARQELKSIKKNRALAKVYEINEKYYSKHGNKMMADANRQAKERILKNSKGSIDDVNSAKAKLANAKNTEEAKALRKEQLKKAAEVGAVAAGTALAAYGAYKLYKKSSDAKAAKAEKEFQAAMESGRKLFAELERNAANNKNALHQVVSVTLPDGSVLLSEFGRK